MEGWMDGWKDGWKDGRMDGRISDGWKDGLMKKIVQCGCVAHRGLRFLKNCVFYVKRCISKI